MKVGGQHHVLASLPPGKTWYPLYRRLGGPQGQSGRVRFITFLRVIYNYRPKTYHFLGCIILQCGPGSVVGIATSYGLYGPGIESRWGRDFPHLSRPALGPTQPPVQWVPGLSPGVKSGRGVTLTPHPLLVPWS